MPVPTHFVISVNFSRPQNNSISYSFAKQCGITSLQPITPDIWSVLRDLRIQSVIFQLQNTHKKLHVKRSLEAWEMSRCHTTDGNYTCFASTRNSGKWQQYIAAVHKEQ